MTGRLDSGVRWNDGGKASVPSVDQEIDFVIPSRERK